MPPFRLCSGYARPLSLPLFMLALGACGGDDGSSSASERDAAVTPSSQGDARITAAHADAGPTSTGVPAPVSTLDALAGRYLLRFDTYGTASAGAGLIAIPSRVSFLWVSNMVVEGDHLIATERLCSQIAEQHCQTGCTSAGTVVDPRTLALYQARMFKRTYTVDDQKTFSGEHAVAALGYDDASEGDAPTDISDSRVWDVVAGGTREGTLSTLTITGSILGDVTCDVYGVQRLSTAFSGTLGGTTAQPVFPAMTVDMTGAVVTRLGASVPICQAQAEAPIDTATARLLRYDEGTGVDCVDASVFDSLLPPAPLN